jgi:hypothetical protein
MRTEYSESDIRQNEQSMNTPRRTGVPASDWSRTRMFGRRVAPELIAGDEKRPSRVLFTRPLPHRRGMW